LRDQVDLDESDKGKKKKRGDVGTLVFKNVCYKKRKTEGISRRDQNWGKPRMKE